MPESRHDPAAVSYFGIFLVCKTHVASLSKYMSTTEWTTTNPACTATKPPANIRADGTSRGSLKGQLRQIQHGATPSRGGETKNNPD